MDSLYPAIKHIHMTFIALSVLFFIVRFALHLKQSPIMDKKIVKVAPHIIDTLLLLSGLTLCFIIKQYPFQDAWLTEKIGAVVAYIFLATIALKANRPKLFKVFAALGALAWIVYAGKIAMVKQAIIMG
ncbi:SirB2 family protein [Shewanella sp. Isolate11]|uniref:SirB2 family protein n=1 Tax=Shewanella sp. Isolate11 TaxID=2908530 RepID=UPI001EFE4CE6|nr:SirB2 family protein [Shewanella sp. Isolate11]MCG9697396.1 SirB2 family protein [Shewanella sp. Isolate11]